MCEKFPASLEYPSELSRLLMKRGRFDKAEAVLRKISKDWPHAKEERCLLALNSKLLHPESIKGFPSTSPTPPPKKQKHIVAISVQK
jgi:hypothetical protein